MSIKSLYFFIASLLFYFPSYCANVLVEFKGACFLPTNSCVKEIYGKHAALYGPEITFQLCQNNNWYGFISADFLSKKGHSIGLCDSTKMNIAALALGAKYVIPFCYAAFYVGLGFQPVHLKTINCSPFVLQKTSKWGFGGIAKVGLYCDIAPNFFIDLFFDYRFARVKCHTCSTYVVPLRAILDAAIFGAGLGYKFN